MSNSTDPNTRPARVRFAPSPTGIMHIGGLRTALFNWLLAKKTGGQFVLRVEDTDRSRYNPDALDSITEALRWLGLDWDEGPEVGGAYGPYVQSERTAIYQKYLARMLENGSAYLCNCSPERLEQLREEQRAQKLPPGYDGHCRDKDPEELKREQENGVPVVARVKVPHDKTAKFKDVVRGDIQFEYAGMADFIVMKSDGMPTYHLAHLVDDYEMKITHVIRGEEWISSVPKHLLIYEAIGVTELPLFVHVPLILGKDRSKLSKRHGNMGALSYRDEGYRADAVLNFLALLGWSPGNDVEIMDLEELIEQFTLDKLQKHPAIFDTDKLRWMNSQYIRNMDDAVLAQELATVIRNAVVSGTLSDVSEQYLKQNYIETLVPLIKERLNTLNDIVGIMGFFFVGPTIAYDLELLSAKSPDSEQLRENLTEAKTLCATIEPFDGTSLEAAFRDKARELDVKTGNFFYPVRIAVTGSRIAPPLFETLELIGRERCLERLQFALDKLNQ